MGFKARVDAPLFALNVAFAYSESILQQWIKAVRVNGQISEVKQLKTNLMGDHLGSIHFVFFSVTEILGELGKFY